MCPLKICDVTALTGVTGEPAEPTKAARERGGNWYRAEDFEMEGWLCPALLKYFDAPPKGIYARFEARAR